MKRFFTLCFILMFYLGFSQDKHLFSHDFLPENDYTYKPEYHPNFPQWAKLLYQEEISFQEVDQLFEEWERKRDKDDFKLIRRYYKNWRKIATDWVDENGFIISDNTEKYLKEVKLHQSDKQENVSLNRNQSSWKPLGPMETVWYNSVDPDTGLSGEPVSWQVNVYAFDVYAKNPNILYAGTETGYLNKSSNAGQSWELVNQYFDFGGAVSAVAIHPNNPNKVLVGSSSGIFSTSNSGKVWKETTSEDNNEIRNVNHILFDPKHPNRVYASAINGLFYSNNGGISWQRKWSESCWDVHIEPNNSDNIISLSRNGGFYELIHSTDAGKTFQALSSDVSSVAVSNGGLLAVTPVNPNRLMCFLLSDNKTPVFMSGEKMHDYSSITFDVITLGNSSHFNIDNGQGYFDIVLEVSPEDENLIFAGTTSLGRSVDGGRSFVRIGGYSGSLKRIHPDMQDAKFVDGQLFWLATDGGMYVSTDAFATQEGFRAKNNGLIGSGFWGFDQAWNEDLIVGGRYHNGNTAIYENYGNKALRIGGAENPTGWILHGKSRHAAFADLGKKGFILPEDIGGTWDGHFPFAKFPNMDNYGGYRGNVVHHPNYHAVIYVGEGNGLWRSEDYGSSFNLLYDFGSKIRYFQISYSNPDIIYADVIGFGLMKSTDGGITWESKSSLYSQSGVHNGWKGKLFFAISPSESDVIYVTFQNNYATEAKGQVFRSLDGGDTWEDITYGLDMHTKAVVVQPDEHGQDLLYLFAKSGSVPAGVYILPHGATEWKDYGQDLPARMRINLPLPFYRDSKIRLASHAGVWENDLAITNFQPIIQPWVPNQIVSCFLDTLQFDDHSILNHSEANWQWTISPEPLYISNRNIRNPKVVLGKSGQFDITLQVTQNGQIFSKHIENLITAESCPSVENCEKPDILDKSLWSLLYVSDEMPNGRGTMAFDNDPNTLWHSQWSPTRLPHPHEIQIDLGRSYSISSFIYDPRDNGPNGRFKDVEVYFSNDAQNWENIDAELQFENVSTPQLKAFATPFEGRYFKLVTRSEVGGRDLASAAEFDFIGCYAENSNQTVVSILHKEFSELGIYPNPTNDEIRFERFNFSSSQSNFYSIYNQNGKLVKSGILDSDRIDVSELSPSIYILIITSEGSPKYRMKIVKN